MSHIRLHIAFVVNEAFSHLICLDLGFLPRQDTSTFCHAKLDGRLRPCLPLEKALNETVRFVCYRGVTEFVRFRGGTKAPPYDV